MLTNLELDAARRIGEHYGKEIVLQNKIILYNAIGDMMGDEGKCLRSQVRLAMDAGLGDLYLAQFRGLSSDAGTRAVALLEQECGMSSATAAHIIEWFNVLTGISIDLPESKENSGIPQNGMGAAGGSAQTPAPWEKPKEETKNEETALQKPGPKKAFSLDGKGIIALLLGAALLVVAVIWLMSTQMNKPANAPRATRKIAPTATPTIQEGALAQGATVDGIFLKEISFYQDKEGAYDEKIATDTLNWNDYPTEEKIKLCVRIAVNQAKDSPHILEIYRDKELICKRYRYGDADAFGDTSYESLFGFLPLPGEYTVYLDGQFLGGKKVTVYGGSPMSELFGQGFNTFVCEGESYTLPIKFSDMLARGWKAYGDDLPEVLEPDKMVDVLLTNDTSTSQMVRVNVVNDSNQTQSFMDCEVQGFDSFTYKTGQLSWRDITIGEPLNNSCYKYAIDSIYNHKLGAYEYDFVNQSLYIRLNKDGNVEYFDVDVFCNHAH